MADIEAAGGEVVALIADLVDDVEVEAAVRRAAEAFGGLDCVIGSAGIQLAGEDDRADRSRSTGRRTRPARCGLPTAG